MSAADTAAHVLREYSLLADGERGALVGPRGDIAWLCAPRWHDGSVFSSLIGGSGVYSTTPAGRFVWGGYYEQRSLIWRSRWVTEDGIVESRDALAYPADEHRVVVLRRVSTIAAPADVEVLLRPRADYDQTRMADVRHADGIWTMRCGDLRLRWRAGAGVRHRDDTLRLTFRVEPDAHRDFVLEISDVDLPDDPPDPDELWRATEAAWADTVPDTTNTLASRDVAHSLAVLHGLTSKGGGMVAAATTSLPERSETGRNYDYRFVWIRDQCFTGQAAAAVGDMALLDAAVAFVGARLRADGAKLAPAYLVTGEPLPPEQRLHLPGYPGGTDIIGNHAGAQFQLDAFGESLLLFAAADRSGRADAEMWQAVDAAVAAITARWREPDAGIWELDDRAWTHSRLIASAGLRAIAARRQGAAATEALALADEILADTARTSLAPEGHWQRAADDPLLDGALLLPALRGALPPGDPRTAATLAAYLRELTVDGYAYRFRHDDRPLPDAEGSFLLCGFLVAMALHEAGDEVEARAWFERTRSSAGPPLLFSEEYDSRQHQMRGNIPQAFVHAVMVEAAARLHRTNDPEEH